MRPEPGLRLQIGTDPTVWVVPGAAEDALARELSQAADPLVLPVAAPFQGRLVLSAQGAATVSVLRAPVAVGAHPTGVAAPGRPVLHLPSVTAASQELPGHELNPDTDLAALEREIVAALASGNRLILHTGGGPGGGVLVLNGAVLDFAVLARVPGVGHGAHPTG
jgi:hypothetical protein